MEKIFILLNIEDDDKEEQILMRMDMFDRLFKRHIKHEFCTRCEADLTLQKGYDNELPYWICKGCNEMLINPAIDTESDIVWVCDKCDAMLNIQPGFSEMVGDWNCTQCGYTNKIDVSEVYLSDDDYRDSLTNPYKDMDASDVITLMKYQEVCKVDGYENIMIVRNRDDGELYIKKEHSTYDKSIYQFFIDNPAPYVPQIHHIYESNGYLIIVEDYIDGKTIGELLENGPMDEDNVIDIFTKLCLAVRSLHNLNPPIIYRDIKPSNIMVDDNDGVYLIDVNVAKWFKARESEDTRLLGTHKYAAPEQYGCGINASSVKTDIYAMGILLNEMITGKFPNECLALGRLGEIVKRCIALDPDRRFTDDELLSAVGALK